MTLSMFFLNSLTLMFYQLFSLPIPWTNMSKYYSFVLSTISNCFDIFSEADESPSEETEC